MTRRHHALRDRTRRRFLWIPAALATATGAVLLVRAQVPGKTAVTTAPMAAYRVVNSYPHDPAAFTQGLIFRDGFLYESTGLHGESSLRKVDLATGRVLLRREVAPQHFAEGLTDWGGRLVQLTWQSNIGFLYDLSTFEPRGTFAYAGEGWGLTHDDSRIIMSDGTSRLRFLDPTTLAERGRLTVHDGGIPVSHLNELEYVRGEIYANVWMTDRIARISPTTGQVVGWIDLTGLLSRQWRTGREDVLNGVAYDALGKRLFVTGKLWPRLFEIQVR